jgi:myo-inositol-1(or 4)-monophosphatase
VPNETISQYLQFATETAFLAGKLTLAHFQAGVRPDFKADDTPVTVADREAELLIRRRIEEDYPSHSIVGEEFGSQETAGASHRWILDPIDGTKPFTRGVPSYSVLIALEIEGRVVVGVAYFPALDEMVYAGADLGCWWNGRRARVSQVDSLERAVLAHADVNSFASHGREEAWQRLARATYFRAGWGDAYGHCLVATGRAELMLDPIMSVWDCGPLLPILQEAGGYFGDWQGNPTIYGKEALSTTARLLPQVLKLIEGS